MSDRLAVLARLARLVGSAPPDEPLAVRLCRACVETLGAEGGAVTLASTTSQRLTLSTSNGISAQIEDLQDVLGEGPGQDAYRDGTLVVTQVDGVRDRSFPVFSQIAGDLTGPLTVWAIPMHHGRTTLGVLTVYRRTGELDCSLADARLLADSVVAALLADPSTHGLNPLTGWPGRTRVHQATGMVVAQLGIGPDDALAILRAHAFATSTTMEVISAEVLARRLGFTQTQTGTWESLETPRDGTTQEEEP